MGNELKEICDLLEGYSEDRSYIVLAAKKTALGWDLTITKKETEVKVADDDN